jgi:hypothetical protein
LGGERREKIGVGSFLPDKLSNFHHNPLIKVEVAREHGVPLSVVRAARDRKKAAVADSEREGDVNLKFDSVWCVFDIDEHPHVAEAKLLAAQHGLELAVSNPCFELWLLLHKRDCPGAEHRHTIQSMLKRYVPDYDKKIYFNYYIHGYKKAVQRAARLHDLAESIGEPGKNPTTDVYKLTECIIPKEDANPDDGAKPEELPEPGDTPA